MSDETEALPLLDGPPDDRPFDVQMLEALDREALRLMQLLNVPSDRTDVKARVEVFKLCQDWVVKRQRVKPEEDEASGFAEMAGRIAQPQPINGILPPPKNKGRPTLAEKAQRDAYDAAKRKQEREDSEDDDSEMMRKLAAKGVVVS